MDFQLPEYFEDDTTPQTETEKLLERIEEIESILLDGNTWRFVNGGVGAFGILGSLLGVSTLSPLSLLLLGSSSVFAGVAYGAYALWEGKELGIKPSVVPLTSGQKESIKELLPLPQKAHYRLVQWYGKEAVEYLESQGTLSEVIRHAGNIKPIEGRTDHAELAKKAIADHYLAKMPKPVKAPRKITQHPTAIPSLNFAPPVENNDIDDSADIWQQPITPSRSPVVENYEDDMDSPVYDNDESDDDWSILDTVKKSNQELISTQNLALEIAENTDSHYCFVAEPRVGKSSLLISTIESIKGDVYFVDCKGDDLRFRNLKKVNSKARYMQVNEEKSLTTFFELLDAIVQTMIARQSNLDRYPITFIIDEINILINIINSYESETGDKNIFNKFKGKMMRILAQGLSSGIRLIFTTHTTKVVELFGTSTALQSVSLIGLGKKGKTKAMNDCIDFKIRPRHRDTISEKVEVALSGNVGAVMALLCDTTPPEIVNIPFVNYDHLLQGVNVKPKQARTIIFPTFDDDEHVEAVKEQSVAFTHNDLLTWLEKRGEGFYPPRKISQNLKISVAEIENAANKLHQSGLIDLKNWGQPQGREIVYFKDIQETTHRNNVIVFPMGV